MTSLNRYQEPASVMTMLQEMSDRITTLEQRSGGGSVSFTLYNSTVAAVTPSSTVWTDLWGAITSATVTAPVLTVSVKARIAGGSGSGSLRLTINGVPGPTTTVTSQVYIETLLTMPVPAALSGARVAVSVQGINAVGSLQVIASIASFQQPDSGSNRTIPLPDN